MSHVTCHLVAPPIGKFGLEVRTCKTCNKETQHKFLVTRGRLERCALLLINLKHTIWPSIAQNRVHVEILIIRCFYIILFVNLVSSLSVKLLWVWTFLQSVRIRKFGSSHPEALYKKSVFKKFAKIVGKHLWWRPY